MTDQMGRRMEITRYLEMIGVHFPDLIVEHVTPITAGWDSFVLEVNGEIIFRFPRRPDVDTQLTREMALLPKLAGALPVQIPRFEFVASDAGDNPGLFVGYRKIAGIQLADQHIEGAQKSSMAWQLANCLRALHAFPVERAVELGTLAHDIDTWRNQYVDLRRRTDEWLAPHLIRAERRRLDRFWEAHLEDERLFRFTPALIHGDLGTEHILCEPERGALVGIIDWGDARIGDPALDFAGFLGDFGEAFTESVIRFYAPDDDGSILKRAGFYTRIAPLYEVEYGHISDEPSHMDRGLEGVRRNLLVHTGG